MAPMNGAPGLDEIYGAATPRHSLVALDVAPPQFWAVWDVSGVLHPWSSAPSACLFRGSVNLLWMAAPLQRFDDEGALRYHISLGDR